jgi:hypothetical protein
MQLLPVTVISKYLNFAKVKKKLISSYLGFVDIFNPDNIFLLLQFLL